jgi:hypothetical protein
VDKHNYTVEPFYQWDRNQVLTIYGLSLPSTPEVHFYNTAMDRAIVRQATMDSAGVITVSVPNGLLQKPYTIQVYVCTYAGSTFETQYKLEIPVKARTQPADYTLEDDQEVYSFNALENQVVNALTRLDRETTAATKALNEATTAQKAAETAYKNAKEDVDKAVENAVDTAMTNIQPTLLSDGTKTAYDLGKEAVPDDAFALLSRFIKGLGNDHIWERRNADQRIEYVNSPDANAYPPAESDGWTYEYLGQLGQGMTRVATGSYVGTGGTGSGSQCSLTFDFIPKLVLVTDSATSIYKVHFMVAIVGSPVASNTNPPSSSDYAHETYVNLTWDGTTLRWYSTAAGAPILQLNESGRRYYYVAFG